MPKDNAPRPRDARGRFAKPLDQADGEKVADGTPLDLGVSGARLWASIAGKWELRPDESRILEDACRESDIVDRLESFMRGGPLFITGSQGQDVLNPAIQEVRQHRAVLRQLLGQLKLPDDDGAKAASGETVSARGAAMSRWHGDSHGARTG